MCCQLGYYDYDYFDNFPRIAIAFEFSPFLYYYNIITTTTSII